MKTRIKQLWQKLFPSTDFDNHTNEMTEIIDWPEILFDVPGAGKIRISEKSTSRTGHAVGFTIGVSWGKHGYSGGVLDRRDALRLAYHIIESLEKITPEQETKDRQEIVDRDNRLKEAGLI